jgi:hypothetical protein
MTIEQTVVIPENRRVYFDVPPRIPLGAVRITVQIAEIPHAGHLESKKKSISALRALRGSCKGEDTLEAYFERKRADKLIEIEHEKHLSGWGE